MLKLLISLMLLGIGLPGPSGSDQASSQCTTPENALDGAYQFVSESAHLSQPKIENIERKSPEWEGIWQFQKGYYTSIMTKAGRERLLMNSGSGVGALAYGGKFEKRGNELVLYQDYAISPLEANRPKSVQYSLHGNVLTLTQTLHPYVEDTRAGTIVTVLKKLQ